MLDLQETRRDDGAAPGERAASTTAGHAGASASLRQIYGLDAQTSEVSENPAGKPQGDRFAQFADQLWRVRSANSRARVDHEHADRSGACRIDSQHEAQRQTVDSDFPR